MPIEQYTESITLQSMKCVLGENDFGYVFPQGDVADVEKVERLLKKAGGKPKVCALDDFSLGGSEVFLGIVSIYLLAFVHAGASVFNQIEHYHL